VGQGKLQTFAHKADAVAAQDRMARRKRLRGYHDRP
jgi:predicted DNA-binding WGR domain protein